MKKDYSVQNKRLVYSSLFNFMYMGKIKVCIYPKGDKFFTLFVQGARIFWDDDDINKSVIIIKEPKYKEKYSCKDIYQACWLFGLVVKMVIDCFKDEDFLSSIDNFTLDFDSLLGEVKEFL